LRTAVIERDTRFGGTCLLRGCIPTKALLHDASLFQEIKNAARHGIKTGEVSIEFGKIQERKNGVVSHLAKGVEFLLRKNKVTSFKGHARIAAPGKIAVKGDSVSTEVIAKNIIVATGSEAKPLPGYTVDEKRVITNVGALEMTQIPRSLLIVGGGAVGVEFASIYNSFGSKVTLIEVLPNIVPLEDQEISKELKRIFTKQGIEVFTGAKLEEAKTKENGVEVTFKTERGEVKKLSVESMLMATGRAPNTANIGLEAVGLSTDRGFIKVNEFMETSVKGIYAIGDVVPTPLLAHVASHEGFVAVERIAGKQPVPINYNHVPNCTYCDPQVASVGFTEAKAVEAGHKIKIGRFPFSAVSKARIEDSTDGFIKVVADEKYGEILGVHLIGSTVTEMVAEAVACMGLEAAVEDVIHTIHAHPTLAEGMHEAMENVYNVAIHI
jgi:dihydrolipoamide dehydrogenase